MMLDFKIVCYYEAYIFYESLPGFLGRLGLTFPGGILQYQTIGKGIFPEGWNNLSGCPYGDVEVFWYLFLAIRPTRYCPAKFPFLQLKQLFHILQCILLFYRFYQQVRGTLYFQMLSVPYFLNFVLAKMRLWKILI